MGVESKGPQNKRKPHIKDVWGQLHIMTWYSISKTCLAIRKKKKLGQILLKFQLSGLILEMPKQNFQRKSLRILKCIHENFFLKQAIYRNIGIVQMGN